MGQLIIGTEQNDWDLASSEQLEINATATSYTTVAVQHLQIIVQLGNTANPLAGGSILGITVKVTPIDTGDKCVMQQIQMNIPTGETFARIVLPTFWIKSGSILEVHAKSSAAGDNSVGGKVWVIDVTPGGGTGATAEELVTALMADTGFTAGGTMTYEELLQLLAGMVAGTWRDKPTDSTKQELLDADDDSTVLLEITLATSTPYKQVGIQI